MQSHQIETVVKPILNQVFNEDICREIVGYIEVKEKYMVLEMKLTSNDVFSDNTYFIKDMVWKETLNMISQTKGLHRREHTPFIKMTGNREYKNGDRKITFKNPIYAFTDIKMKVELIISNDRKNADLTLYWERIPQKSKNPRFGPTPYF